MTHPSPVPPRARGLRRLFRAFGYSCQGLAAAWHSEPAFRQEVVLAIIMLPAAFFVGRTAIEIFLLCLTVVLVLVIELINSAIEALADAITHEYHPLIGKAKDTGSAAVLLSLIITGAWWAYVILDRWVFI
ncbi:MAG TPA: diacylglycerol kinase [Burkholderiaceae bacterium]|nr:diacylglycerol kinase [Burkholderiaceae bacterium]